MQNGIKYDVSIVDQRHDKAKTMFGPMWQAMASHCRFEDGVEGQPDTGISDGGGTDAGISTGVVDSPTGGSLLDVAGLVNPDGSFVEGWLESDLLPEDVRGSESLKVIKNIGDLAKRTVHAEKLVGKQKVPLPKADASEEELASFWDAVRQSNPDAVRPSTPDEYATEVPEDMAEMFPEGRVKEAKEFAHKIGITKKQFDAYMANEFEVTRQAMAEMQAEQDRTHDENVLALKKEWGEAYAERQHIVKRLISETFGSNETGKMNFLQKYAGDPDFVRFAADIGAKMVEHKSIVAELTQQTPSEALGKIKELEATPGYLNMGSDMTDAQRSEISAKIREQYQIAYPERR